MEAEGSIHIDPRRYGRLAFLRQKQWWSFEGLDPERQLYFVVLALEGLPSSYVSFKVIDYGRKLRWEEDHLGAFSAAAGNAVSVMAEAKWGQLRLQGQAESGWQVDVQTPTVQIHCQYTATAPQHANHLFTRHLDYHISQFPMDMVRGQVCLDGQELAFTGYGYHEHNWGVQPRHSRANWLHFWGAEMASIVLDCHYDAGVPHHYTYFWYQGQWRYLFSPAQFFFSPERLDQTWQIKSPDLDLTISPLYAHHSRMRIPPIFSYINIDYYEILVNVAGNVLLDGRPVEVTGLGKFDHNFNLW